MLGIVAVPTCVVVNLFLEAVLAGRAAPGVLRAVKRGCRGEAASKRFAEEARGGWGDMGGAETPYGLRPATAFEFIFQLNKANMRRYVELLRGWDDAAERPARHPGRGPRRRPARHADGAQPDPARRLYERLGFRAVGEYDAGPKGVKIRMRARPAHVRAFRIEEGVTS